MDVDRLFRVLGFLAILAIFITLCVLAVRYAKKGSGGAAVLGAALMLMGFGNMRDPTNTAVQEAKQSKKGQEGESGDPPVKD